MGKKTKSVQSLDSLASNCAPIIEVRYKQPLFSLLCHPTKPLLFSGLASGHIFCHRYDPTILQSHLVKVTDERKSNKTDLEPKEKPWSVVEVGEDGSANIEGFQLVWKTRRHKGSVRSMCFGDDGKVLYSIGRDNIIKKANTENGKVVKKVTLSSDSQIKYTKILKSDTHPLLMIGDEDGNVTVLDSETLIFKNSIKKIHSGDAINDIFHFCSKSVYKFISLGQTTLAYWDARKSNEDDFKISPDDTDAKRQVFQSDDQEDEILCGTFVNPEDGQILVCGMGEGVLTIWKPKKNNLVDQISRIKVKKSESLDCIVPTLQDDNCIWTGCSDGQIYKINIKTSKILEIRKHSNLDEVSFLDLDYEYRLVSGGMDKVKIWQFQDENGEDDPVDEESQDESGHSLSSDLSEDAESDDSEGGSSDSSTSDGSEDDEVDADDADDADDVWDKLEAGTGGAIEEPDKQKDTSVGLSREELIKELDKDITDDEISGKRLSSDNVSTQPNKKTKKLQRKQLTSKQLRNLQKVEHGIKKFEGL